MTTTYTFDVFSSLDGFGAHSGYWGGYWRKQGPELLDHHLALYDEEGRRSDGSIALSRSVHGGGGRGDRRCLACMAGRP
jgi:hypothetical protein